MSNNTAGKVIVIFNGPPNSGKDFAAKAMSQKFGVPHFEMKAALRKMAHSIVAVHLEATTVLPEEATALEVAAEFCWEYEANAFLKNNSRAAAFGYRTWRQFLIHISEDIMKPIFGQDVFGRAAAKLVREMDADLCFFSDGGFQVEVEELRKEGTVIVIQLERIGCSWNGDSRGYINGDHTVPFTNPGDAKFIPRIEQRILDLLYCVNPELEEKYANKT